MRLQLPKPLILFAILGVKIFVCLPMAKAASESEAWMRRFTQQLKSEKSFEKKKILFQETFLKIKDKIEKPGPSLDDYDEWLGLRYFSLKPIDQILRDRKDSPSKEGCKAAKNNIIELNPHPNGLLGQTNPTGEWALEILKEFCPSQLKGSNQKLTQSRNKCPLADTSRTWYLPIKVYGGANGNC